MLLTPLPVRPRPTPQPELDVAARFRQGEPPERPAAHRPRPVPQPQATEQYTGPTEAPPRPPREPATFRTASTLFLKRLSWKRVAQVTGLVRQSA